MKPVMHTEQAMLALFDHVPMGCCVLRNDGAVLFWNRCLEDWTGLARESIVGKDIAAHFPHLREPQYWDRLACTFENGPPAIFSTQRHSHVFPSPLPSGELRIQHTTVTPLPVPGSKAAYALFFVEDVTETTRQTHAHRAMRDQALREIELREKAERQQAKLAHRVRQAEKMESLNVMAGAIAHNFNNLLMAVIGNLDLALEDLSPESPSGRSVSRADEAARKAAELSTLMLTYVGQVTEPTAYVNLAESVAQGLGSLQDSLPTNIHCKMRIGKDLPSIKAAPNHLQRILACLITNAVEAVGTEPGAIEVTSGAIYCGQAYLRQTYVDDELPEGPYVFLKVADTGCGMSQETKARIFDPFFTTKFPGRGLGLPSVLGIVRGHKGAVEVSSEEGHGTILRVLFPALDRRKEPQEACAKDRRKQARNSDSDHLSGTVLLVDDEEIVRKAGCAVLQRIGMDVLTAADGVEAIEEYRKHAEEISCVLLDLTMPRKDGYETFQELHSIKADLPIILLSGYQEEDATQRFADKGVAGFLQKPYRTQEIEQKLHDILK